MAEAELLAEVRRGPFVESLHNGHAVIVTPDGRVVESWGNPNLITLPRSSAKIIQALPLVESDAGSGLDAEQLALACASHSAEPRHVARVREWLAETGLTEDDLRCGPEISRDKELADDMVRSGEPVTRVHNNCSGKHTGFLMLGKSLGAGPEYVDPAHPVQLAVREAFEDMTGMESPGFGVDGCSAPNFATSLKGLAHAMAKIADSDARPGVRAAAAVRLRDAMISHPEMVGGEGRASTELARATSVPVAIKSGAEGVYVAMLPGQKLGVALKVADGAGRAAEVAMAALLVRLGVLDADHPTAACYLSFPVTNRNDEVTGTIRPARGLLA